MSKDVATVQQPTHPSAEKGGVGVGGAQLPNNAAGTGVPPMSPRPVPGGGSVVMLEQEVLYLRQELTAAREQIKKLQDQEKQLRER